MISKKKLKERLIDICNGAGMHWDQLEYFDYQDSALECTGRAILAIERAFALPEDTRLRNPQCLDEYDEMDSMVDIVHNAIIHDKGD